MERGREEAFQASYNDLPAREEARTLPVCCNSIFSDPGPRCSLAILGERPVSARLAVVPHCGDRLLSQPQPALSLSRGNWSSCPGAAVRTFEEDDVIGSHDREAAGIVPP
jgi:hypothetical protein